MLHLLRLVDRRVGDGDGGWCSCFTTCCGAGGDSVASERVSLEVSQQHHVEHPKSGQHSTKEQRNGTGGRP
jgi:hypothetical protein